MDLSYNQRYYLANREKLIAYQYKYRHEQADKFTSYQRRYKAELYNKPETRRFIIEYQREYRRKNPHRYHQHKSLDEKNSKENEMIDKIVIIHNINKLIEFKI